RRARHPAPGPSQAAGTRRPRARRRCGHLRPRPNPPHAPRGLRRPTRTGAHRPEKIDHSSAATQRSYIPREEHPRTATPETAPTEPETAREQSEASERKTSFSGEELQQLLGLIKDSDSVELKVTVPDSAHRSTLVALGIDPLEAQIRLVTFFDTPNLALNKATGVVRAGRIEGKGDDSVIKLRPVVPGELPAELRRSASFNVEVDALPGGFVCSASMKGALRPTDVKRALAGELPQRKLFSKEQRAFF